MHLFPLTISTAVSTVGPVSMCVYDSDQCSRLLISPICSSNRFDPAPREARQDSCLLEAKKTAQKHKQTSQPWSAVRNINSMDLLGGSSTSGVICVCVCDVVQVSKKQRYFMVLLGFFFFFFKFHYWFANIREMTSFLKALSVTDSPS